MAVFELGKLLASRKLKFKNGEIDLVDQVVALVPVDWVITLQKYLESKNSENLIYYSAKEMGVRWFKSMYENFKISAEDVIIWGIKILTLAGWGETTTPEINFSKKFYTVILHGSAEGKKFGNVGYAVDHFVRGCYASGAKVLFGVESDAIEMNCISAGSPVCKFIAQPTKNFDKNNPLVKRQLNSEMNKLVNFERGVKK